MPESQNVPPKKKRVFADLSPLREAPAFARLWLGTMLNGIGTQLTIVAVGLQIYAIAHSTAAVALVGGIALIPMVLAGPLGGMAADAFNRKMLMIVSASVMFASTLGLLMLSFFESAASQSGQHIELWPFYLLTTISSVSGTVLGGTRQTVIPAILPAKLITAGAALNGISMGTQVMLGPALAGISVAFLGYGPTFAGDLILTAAGFLGILTLPKIPVAVDAIRPGWKAFKESIAFLRATPAIGAGFVVDIIAMSLGRPYVLLPAAASLVIGGGPVTVGIITAAGAAGSFLTSVFSGQVRHIKHQGLAIANAVKVYGGFVVLFGLVLAAMQTGWFGQVGGSLSQVSWPALLLASLAFMGMGASDEVSAIFRTAMLITAAPDEMRGRMQGLFMSVVLGGPRIGDLYAGAAASLLGLWAGPVIGGVAIAALMFVLLAVTPSLKNFVVE